jgi:hypothetical protein
MVPGTWIGIVGREDRFFGNEELLPFSPKNAKRYCNLLMLK